MALPQLHIQALLLLVSWFSLYTRLSFTTLKGNILGPGVLYGWGDHWREAVPLIIRDKSGDFTDQWMWENLKILCCSLIGVMKHVEGYLLLGSPVRHIK
jgi:hypothetical protein